MGAARRGRVGGLLGDTGEDTVGVGIIAEEEEEEAEGIAKPVDGIGSNGN